MMSRDMAMDLLRHVLTLLGAVATAFGWLTPGEVTTWTNLIMQVGGPLLIAVGSVWGLFANTKASIVTSAAEMPEVKSIVLDKDEAATADLEQVTPSNVVAK